MKRSHYSVRVKNLPSVKRLPSTHSLQAIVYLSMMWIAIFGFAVGAWTFFGGMLSTQLAVLAGLIVTVVAFLCADMRNHGDMEDMLMRAPRRR